MQNIREKIEKGENFKNFKEGIKAYNAAVLSDSASGIANAKKKVNESLEALNEELKEAEYKEIASHKEPIKEIVTMGSLELYSTKTTKNKDSDKETMEVSSKMQIFDIADFWTRVDQPLNMFHSRDWETVLPKFGQAIFKMKCDEMHILPTAVSKKYQGWLVDKLEKEFNLASATSITGATKIAQRIMDSVLYEPEKDKNGVEHNKYKVETRHTKALLNNFTSWSNSTINAVTFPKDSTFRQMMMRIMHMVVTGKEIITD